MPDRQQQSMMVGFYARRLQIPTARSEDFVKALFDFAEDQDLLEFVQGHPDLASVNLEDAESPLFRVLVGIAILDRLQQAYGELPEEMARDMRAYLKEWRREFRSIRDR